VHDQSAPRPTILASASGSGKAVKGFQCPSAIAGGRQLENRAAATRAAVSGGAVEVARLVKYQAGGGIRSVVSVPKTVEGTVCPASPYGHQLENHAVVIQAALFCRTVEVAGVVEDHAVLRICSVIARECVKNALRIPATRRRLFVNKTIAITPGRSGAVDVTRLVEQEVNICGVRSVTTAEVEKHGFHPGAEYGFAN